MVKTVPDNEEERRLLEGLVGLGIAEYVPGGYQLTKKGHRSIGHMKKTGEWDEMEAKEEAKRRK